MSHQLLAEKLEGKDFNVFHFEKMNGRIYLVCNPGKLKKSKLWGVLLDHLAQMLFKGPD